MTAVVSATGAAAQDTGWYGALDIGYHRTEVLRTHSATLESDGQPYNFHFGHTDSWTGFARVGYKLSPHLRLELEGGYRPGDVNNVYDSSARPVTAICSSSSVSPACGRPDGSLHAWTLMGNLLVDLMPDGMVDPFVGGGLGVARTSLSLNGVSRSTTPALNNQGLVSDDADTKFAWQGIAGVSVRASERLNIDVTYRYLGSQRSNFTTVGAGTVQPGVIDGAYKDQSITIGLRYALSAPPPPPPPPPPVYEAKDFIVYFPFDQYVLTPEAQSVVQEAAKYATDGHASKEIVVGHTDTSGSVAYNMRLSERRAKATADALVNLGVPASSLDVSWKGKSEPAVQTGDGVKEPLNRRSTIHVQF